MIGEASTTNPTKHGIAISIVSRIVWLILFCICVRFLEATAAVSAGITDAARPFAMASGMLIKVLYFPV